MGAVIPFPTPRTRDLIEIRKTGVLWSIVIVRPQGSLRLADCHSQSTAERFARRIAEVRGSMSVIIREAAP